MRSYATSLLPMLLFALIGGLLFMGCIENSDDDGGAKATPVDDDGGDGGDDGDDGGRGDRTDAGPGEDAVLVDTFFTLNGHELISFGTRFDPTTGEIDLDCFEIPYFRVFDLEIYEEDDDTYVFFQETADSEAEYALVQDLGVSEEGEDGEEYQGYFFEYEFDEGTATTTVEVTLFFPVENDTQFFGIGKTETVDGDLVCSGEDFWSGYSTDVKRDSPIDGLWDLNIFPDKDAECDTESSSFEDVEFIQSPLFEEGYQLTVVIVPGFEDAPIVIGLPAEFLSNLPTNDDGELQVLWNLNHDYDGPLIAGSLSYETFGEEEVLFGALDRVYLDFTNEEEIVDCEQGEYWEFVRDVIED